MNMEKNSASAGFKGHYTNAFGTLDDMLAGCDYLVSAAKTAGVAV